MKLKCLIHSAVTGLLILFSCMQVQAQVQQQYQPQSQSQYQSQSQPQQYQPIEINYAAGKVMVYQPQPEILQGNDLTGIAAVSLTQPGKDTPVFGAIKFRSQVQIDWNNRTFSWLNIKVDKVKFPDFNAQQEKEFAQAIEADFPKHNVHGSLDTLLEDLASAKTEAQVGSALQVNPPKIIYTAYSAVLVPINGQPILLPIEKSNLMRVANTPMMMLFNKSDKKYYLASGSAWYSSSNVMGPWQIDNNPPQEIASIVTKDGKPIVTAGAANSAEMPKIIIATEPSELISSNGTAQFSPIAGTDLLFMSNTKNDVFMDVKSQTYYTLISGRWYASKSLQQGPWNFVAPDQLPTDFSKIPADSQKANVLVSVPNTEAAQDAVTESQLPKTNVVKRSDVKLVVKYDGKPKFVRIKGTNIQYAINTATPVLLIGGKYYACDNAVWYVGKTPYGPWKVADYVPSEVKKIPPSSPVYRVKYVRVYYSDPDYVYFGYTPGYYGWYPYDNTVVYGTGYWYPGWYGNYYYPGFLTYGLGIQLYPGFWWDYGYGWGWPYSFLTVGLAWNYGWGGYGWYGPGWYGPGWYGGGGWYNGWCGQGWCGRGWRGANWYNRYWDNKNAWFNRANFGNRINIGNHRFNVGSNFMGGRHGGAFGAAAAGGIHGISGIHGAGVRGVHGGAISGVGGVGGVHGAGARGIGGVHGISGTHGISSGVHGAVGTRGVHGGSISGVRGVGGGIHGAGTRGIRGGSVSGVRGISGAGAHGRAVVRGGQYRGAVVHGGQYRGTVGRGYVGHGGAAGSNIIIPRGGFTGGGFGGFGHGGGFGGGGFVGSHGGGFGGGGFGGHGGGFGGGGFGGGGHGGGFGGGGHGGGHR